MIESEFVISSASHISVASTPILHQEKAFSNLSCSAVKVGEKRQRNQYADEICNADEQHSSSGSNGNGCAERGEEVCAALKFNDFEKLREEVNFEVGQTWALYDDKVDGMPRLYARIRKVSAPSFELRITYLEPDPDDERQIQWLEQDLPVSAGQFKLGKHHNTKVLSIFSHVIHCKEGSNNGHLTVSPRKGETWALFKNWDINWSSEPASHRSYEYEFVEILSDYADKAGVSVAFLHKAKGYASVFFRMGTAHARISPHSLYRFSHSVPSIKLTGTEAKGVPKDAYELDQAALPNAIQEVIVPTLESNNSKPKRQDIYFASKGKVFKTGQIWSFCSGYDDLPLYYGKIQKITFTHAFKQKKVVFKLHIGRLKSIPFPMDVSEWEVKRMPVGCGTFYARKALEIISPSQLSHQVVNPQVSLDGTEYTILPKVGEVWVIYRYWCYDLDIEDPDEFGFNEYDVVEIFDDPLDYKVLLLELQPVNGEDRLGEDEDKDEYSFLRAVKGSKYHGEDDDESEPEFTIPKWKRLRFSNKVVASRVTREIHGELKDLLKVEARALPSCIRYPDF